nr:MAG: hypothetical protein DIU68_00015 [Chloroflexota bacterium]
MGNRWLLTGGRFGRNDNLSPRFNSRQPFDTSMNINRIRNMNVDSVTFAKAIADDTRQEIMKHLCCVWLNVSDLVTKLEGRVNQPTVSHHLKKLEEANLVLVRVEGRQRFYTLNQEQMTICCGMLVRRFAPDYAENIVAIDAIPAVKA